MGVCVSLISWSVVESSSGKMVVMSGQVWPYPGRSFRNCRGLLAKVPGQRTIPSNSSPLHLLWSFRLTSFGVKDVNLGFRQLAFPY